MHLYAVSNDHVVRDAPVVRLVTTTSEVVIKTGEWATHKDRDDVAICALGLFPDDLYWANHPDGLITRDDLNPNDLAVGEDCMMIGRHVTVDDRQLDQPVVRFGNLAMLPELVHQRSRSHNQESFLVDLRSHPGFSGSPVYVYFAEPIKIGAGERFFDLGTRMRVGKTWLLGIHWGRLPQWNNVYKPGEYEVPAGQLQTNEGLAGVVPAWQISEMLTMDRLVEGRLVAERGAGGREPPAAGPDVFGPAHG
jgi:hypothetical protein